MFDQMLGQLAVVAVFVQRLVSFLKPAYQNSKYQKYMDAGISLMISAALCVSWGVDVFAVVGIHFTAVWLGAAFTGVFASFGSNVLNDLLFFLKVWKTKQLPE